MNLQYRIFSLTILLLLSHSLHTYANPQGENVVAGSASFDRSNSKSLVVETSSNKSIINWQNFSISSDESTRFNQPNAASTVLNRVVGVDPSNIMGNLSSNGKLFLVNPNGILFGSDSKVNAPALLASTLDISNEDFLNDNYKFTKNGGDAYIINEGRLASSPGGYIVLLSQTVRNDGVLVAPLGKLALASGDKMTLGLDNQSQISVVIDEAVKGEISNNGAINGQNVILTSKVLNDALENAVNNTGVIEASSLQMISNGDIHSTGVIESDFLLERGNVFQVGGIFNPGIAYVENTDNAITYTSNTNVSGTITDPANIIVNPSVILTMTGNTAFNAGSAFTMDSTSSIDGNGYDLSLTAGANSALGNIYDVDLFTLNPASTTDITFTSNSNSMFVVNTVKTNNYSILSRDVGTGTSDDPIMIYSDSNAPGGLQYIPTSGLGLYYQQANSIDASETSNWNSGAGFVPIGDSTTPFTGNYNGAIYEISNLNVNTTSDYAGLFGYLSGSGELSDLQLANENITGGNYVGGLLGYNNGTVVGSYSSGSVNGDSYVGGLIGYNAKNIVVTYSTADVSGTGNYIGGLVGTNNPGYIVDSYSSGTVDGADYVGGLSGDNHGTIENSFSVSNVTGSGTHIGGLNGDNSGTITDSYYTDNTHGTQGGGTLETGGEIALEDATHPVYANGLHTIDPVTTTDSGVFSNGKIIIDGKVIQEGRFIRIIKGRMLPIFLTVAVATAVLDTYVWTGKTNHDWDVSSNWFRNRLPPNDIYPIIVITNPYNNNPVLTSDWNTFMLEVFPGASFDPGPYNITGSVLANQGTLLVKELLFSSNYLFPIPILNYGTISYSGSGHIVASGLNYYNLDIQSSGTVVFDGPSITTTNNFTLGPTADITLILDTALNAGKAFLMAPDATINGGVHSLSITAGASSTLGGITNVTDFILGPSTDSNSNVIFTSNPASSFSVYNVKTNYLSSLSRDVTDGNGKQEIFSVSDAPGGLEYIQNETNNPGGLSKDYILMNNIDASETSQWNSGAGFLPIGSADNLPMGALPTPAHPFTGSFDGQNYTIHNLTVNAPTANYAGLFGYTSSAASLSNIKLEDVSISGAALVGGLVGFNLGSISNSSTTGTVTGDPTDLFGFTGGLVGLNIGPALVPGTNGSISDSETNVTVSGSNYVGGLLGANFGGDIDESPSQGTVTGTGYNIGGLMGQNGGSITNSNNSGNVFAGDDSSYNIGGLVGENEGSISSSDNTGTVTSGSGNVGGLVGNNLEGGVISYSSNSGDITNIDSNVETENWCGGLCIGGLVGFNSGSIVYSNSSGIMQVSGAFAEDAGGLVGFNDFTSSISNSFSDMTLDITEGSGQSSVGGLVGVNYGSIDASYNQGDVTTDNTAPGSGLLYVDGGLVGANFGSIVNSYNTGDVDMSLSGAVADAGGLVGFNGSSTIGGTTYHGTINKTYNTGEVKVLGGSYVALGGNAIGGLVGNNQPGSSIANSFSTGYVSGGGALGGFVGWEAGSITNSAWWTGVSAPAIGEIYQTGIGTAPLSLLSSMGLGADVATLSDFYSSSLSVYSGWNFTSIWYSPSGDYPLLR